jgi:predicted DNA binding CopG/RHH family protein
MKKTLSEAQIALIRKKISELTDEPLQPIDFTDAELGLGMDLDINVNTDFDFTALPTLVARPSTPVARAPCPGTKKMCIRMPNSLTQLFKDEAKRRGTQYQTLMIRKLKEASKGW